MPGRPTKKWWGRCVAGVSEKGGAIDPSRVCGAVWARKGPKERAAIARSEKRGASFERPGRSHDGYTIEVRRAGKWKFEATMESSEGANDFAKSLASSTGSNTRVIDGGGCVLFGFIVSTQPGRRPNIAL